MAAQTGRDQTEIARRGNGGSGDAVGGVVPKSLSQRRVERGVFEKPAGSGEYWIVWKDGAGRRHREKIGRSRELARAAYQRRRLEVREGKLFPDSLRARRGATFTQLCADFKASHPKHWAILRTGYFSIVESWWPNVPASLVGPHQIQQQLAKIESEREIRGSTVNRYRAVLSAIFSHAVRSGRTDRNPVKLVKQRREDGQRTRFLSYDEEKALLDTVRAFYPQHEAEVLLALHTGMRYGEQKALRWEDVDVQARVVIIRRSKAGKPRVIPLNTVACDAVIRMRGNAHVCPQTPVRFWFERCCASAGITGFTWHDLRHTFASRLAMQGTSLKAIQELLGHSSIQTTMRYAHLGPGYSRDAVMALAGATSGATEQNQESQNKPQVVRSA